MKIAIIGAGISGLYLAWKLSEKGHSVTVFERKTRIGQEVCSGLFSKRILEFIPECRKLIQNKINFVLLHFPRKTVRVDFSKEFFVISHFELDNLVAELAQREGAKILLNHNISSIPQRYDRVIGCDGANSFVRKSLGLPEPSFRIGGLRFIKKKDYSNHIQVWPYKNGFSWKIPRGEDIEYGIIKELGSFIKGSESRIIPQGLIIPQHDSITLCGDAAGLTKPWSGGGVIWGLTGAEILLKNFPDFLKYRRAMRGFFIPKIIFSKTAIKLVCFLGHRIPWLLPKKARMESDFLLKKGKR